MTCQDETGYPCLNVQCSECLMLACEICTHEYASHWTTNDGQYSGCSECHTCEGFGYQE